MEISNTTKNIKTKMIICESVSLCLTFLPLLVYVIRAFVTAGVTQKLALSILALVALVLTIINVLFKYSIRSTVWILLLGISICLENIAPLLVIVALCTILDEFVVTPLCKKFRAEFKINKEIDKREQL